MSDIHVDVVVVGAGPAGVAAGIGAREAGAGRVLVIERDWDLGGILSGIGKASAEAGGGGIFTLVNGLDRLNEGINSVAGQESLTRFFAAAGAGTDLMMDGIGNLLSGLTSHMGAIEHIKLSGACGQGRRRRCGVADQHHQLGDGRES